ncbi:MULTISPECIES: D-2-hydroxyacid dehydrogenase [Paenibacillus]|uniref:D-2-hydroxyacid dehydrogenase n=1 Tax=Paenibacillus violae TaxID=3077234 RepID=A0ABU3RJD4_9BACL|nr:MULTISPECIES: D-2-hydroxyacid dehydrogenase [Paenibacillus]MDU0204144.1 D-2-hydroxyacid dehydrogenase [Paenibacillus sp. PFR10]MEC0266562.1 D-2-hydroxyacid dehydrogenase [Paenibacillus anseongense]
MKIVAITDMNLSLMQERMPQDLKGRTEFHWFRSSKDAQEHIADAEVIITAGRIHPEYATKERAPKLRWMQTLSAGVDKLPLQELAERQIPLTNARGVHTIQMSEFTLSLMLQWVRKSNKLYECQLQKEWYQRISVGELSGKTLGIVGAGAIGEAVARKAKAFDMSVIGLNRSGTPQPGYDQTLSGDEGLRTLLAQSDFVVLLLPSTPKTRGLITKEHLSLMKPSAFLINLARGDVIDEGALTLMLQEGKLAGAALDVFEQEPLPATSPLWSMTNVIVTPHIAGSSSHYTERVSAIFYHNLRALLDGGEMMNLVNIHEGY